MSYCLSNEPKTAAIRPKTMIEAAKRKHFQDLLCAQVSQKRICEILGVGLSTVKRVNRHMKGGKTMERSMVCEEKEVATLQVVLEVVS